MRYCAWIFDFDYTLADSTDGIVECFWYAFEKLGLNRPDRAAVVRTIGSTLHDSFIMLTESDDIELNDAFKKLFISRADKIMTEKTKLFSDTIPTLQFLKQSGCKTGIVTTKFRYRIEDALRKYEITHLIDGIVGIEDVEREKPDSEGLNGLIHTLAVSKESVLYVGDTVIDAQTADNAGVDFGAVTSGVTGKDIFFDYPHQYICKNLSELMQEVKKDDGISL